MALGSIQQFSVLMIPRTSPMLQLSLCSLCCECQTDHQTDREAGRSDLHSVDGGVDAKSLGTDKKTQEMKAEVRLSNLGRFYCAVK